MVKWSETIQVQFTHAGMVKPQRSAPWAPRFCFFFFLGAHKGFQWFLVLLVKSSHFQKWGHSFSDTQPHAAAAAAQDWDLLLCLGVSAQTCVLDISTPGENLLGFISPGWVPCKVPGVNVCLGCRRF